MTFPLFLFIYTYMRTYFIDVTAMPGSLPQNQRQHTTLTQLSSAMPVVIIASTTTYYALFIVEHSCSVKCTFAQCLSQ